METLEAIRSRKSIREYTTQSVPDEMIQKLLEAAMQAPSAGNQQPWHFVVVTNRSTLVSLAEVLRHGKMLTTAPLAIIVCSDLEIEKYRGYWVQDCSAATQNLLLAAHDQGLGAVWLGIYPVDERVASIKQILQMPEMVIPLCIVSIGYPMNRLEPATNRYDPARLHKNQW